MAADVNVYFAIEGVLNGEPVQSFGSGVVPVAGEAKELDSTTEPRFIPLKVPAGEIVDLWAWADTNGYDLLTIKIKGGAGTVVVWERYSAATSATDLTPTGTNPFWFNSELSCVGVHNRDSDRAYGHATAATAIGDTAGAPTLQASGSKFKGVADLIQVENEGDDDVTVLVQIWPKE